MRKAALALHKKHYLFPLLVAFGCSPTTRDGSLSAGEVGSSGGGSEGDSSSSAGSDGGSGEDDGGDGDSSAGDGDTGGTGEDSGESGGGIRLDVAGGAESAGAEGGNCDPDTDPDCGCTMVDILFVVDNSLSMGVHQQNIANAFPQFVDAMFTTLPPGTNLHVGVTSTEFGYTPSGGSTSSASGACSSRPQEGSLDDLYITPDQTDLGGLSQGRLRVVDGQAFYEIETDAADSERTAFTDWFGQAVMLGEGGSNVEMSSAAAAWVGDPANEGTNGGFIRDEGAVYVIIFIQDEWDQSPVDSMETGAMIAAQKAACGGMNCVVGGGWYSADCNTVNGVSNLKGLVEQFSDSFQRRLTWNSPPINGNDLAMVLTDIIATKCQEIPPVG